MQPEQLRRRMPKTQTVFITITAAAALGAIATIGSVAQQALSGAQKLMVVQATRLPGKVHILPATLETTQWGWFDNAELPRLTVDSGDTVVFETMSHSHGQLWPGRTIDELKKLRTDWPGRGPMTITGPVFVNTAEPGDVLQIKINKIVARPWGANFNVPGLFGQFPKEFPDGQVKYFYLDWERKVAEFGPGIEIPLRPFPGTLGVARAARALQRRPAGPLCRKSGQSRAYRRRHLACAGVRARRAGVDRGLACRPGQRRGKSHSHRNRISGNQRNYHCRQDAQARMASDRDRKRLDHNGFR